MAEEKLNQAVNRMTRVAQARAAETSRIETVRAQGFVPSECGPEIKQAPARGPIRVFSEKQFYPKGENDFEVKDAGYMGRKSMQLADGFDVMRAQYLRKEKPFPLSPQQVAMGRHYAALVEKHASAGVRCSSVESLPQSNGGGSQSSFIDAVLADRERIDVMRARIGTAVSLPIRRRRPSSRGSKISIRDRTIVDMVCIQGKTATEVLRCHGWSNSGKNIKSVMTALSDALTRMMGPNRGDEIRSMHNGEKPKINWD